MRLSREQVLHMAALCRIALTEEEVERFREQLSHILDQFEVLKELDTEGVPPTRHVVPLHNVMEEDEPRDPYPTEAVLANAPQREEDFFRVPAVLEEA